MNKEQFEIVKTMQAMGIKHTDFAKACKVKSSLMAKAYNANNYEQFKKPVSKEDYGDLFNSMFGNF